MKIKNIFLLSLLFVSHLVSAQSKTYNIYIDKDNRATTGCTVLQPDFATQFDGVDGYISIETGGSPVTITSSLYFDCTGAVFDAGSAIVDAALGLNTSTSGEDVFEAQINTGNLDIRSSTVLRLYYTAESLNSSDIVTISNSGGAILFGVAFPIPFLSFTSLLLLALIIFVVAKRAHKNKILIVATVLLFSTVVWGMVIFIIDGEVNDWSGFTAIDDPLGDNSAPGNFSDITHVYANLDRDLFTARIDVVDVENQAPTADDVMAGNMLEDATLMITLTGTDLDGDALTFSVDTVPGNGQVSAVTPINATSASAIYTPDLDYVGTDTFTYVANDGQVNSVPATVSLTVDPVNDAPSFTNGGDVSVDEDTGAFSNAWATAISSGPTDESSQTTSFNVTNVTNAGLFTTAPLVDASGNLTFEPAPDAAGTATVTLNIMDDGGVANGGVDTSVEQIFVVTIVDINDEPSFTAGASQTALEDAGAQSVAWATAQSAGPPSESGQILNFNVSNNNNGLFSTQPAVDSSGNLTYTSALNANGSATVTVNIIDDGGTANGGDDTSPDQMFVITVTAVNDAPSFINGGNVSVNEDSGAFSVPWATALSTGPADESAQTLSFNASNDNNGLFSTQPSVNSIGVLSFATVSNANGVATVSVSIMDNGGVINGGVDTSLAQMVTITINAVNDEPAFTKGADQSVIQNSGAQTVNAWVLASSVGPANEAGQILSYNVSNDNNALFSVQPSVNSAGDLTYTSAMNQNGMATVTINVMDDGGTTNGGDDTSADQTFTITITNPPPAKVDPSYNVTTNIQVNIPVGTGLLNGATGGTGALTVGNAINPAPTTTTNGGDLFITTVTGVFTYNPPAGQDSGPDTFIYKICDTLDVCSADITTTFNISGSSIWFVDTAAAVGGDGRLTDPLNSIAAFNAIQGAGGTAGAADGDFIYMEGGSYSGSITLLDNQTLIGKGTTLGTVDSIAMISPTAESSLRPALNGAQPVITSATSAITTGMNNTIRGIEVGDTVALGLTAINFGTLTISDVDIVGMGGIVNINNGILNVTFGTLGSSVNTNNGAISIQNVTGGSFAVSGGGTSVTSANNGVVLVNNNSATFEFNGTTGLSINATAGATSAFRVSNGGIITSVGNGVITSGNIAAVDLDTTQIGAAGLTFQSVSANGGSSGIILSTVSGTGTFRVSGTGTTNGSGGTMQNTVQNGIFIANANNIDIRNMNLTNATTVDTGAANTNAAIELITVSNINLVNLDLTGHLEHGILGTSVTNLDISDTTIDGTGADTETNEHGIFITNLLGSGALSSVFDNMVITDSQDTAILIVNNTAATSLASIENSTITNAGDSGINLITSNPATNLTVNVTASMITNTVDGVSYVSESGALIGTVGGAGGLSNTFAPGGGGDMVNGISFFANGSGGASPTVSGTAINNMITLNSAPSVSGLNGVGIATNGMGTVNVDVNNNTINSPFSGILTQTVHGVLVNNEGTGTTSQNIVSIDNNDITLNPAAGSMTAETVGIGVDGGLSGGGITVRSTNNTIVATGDASNGASLGVQILPTENGDPANTMNRVCIGFTGNNVFTPNNPFAAAFLTGELDVLAAPVSTGSFLDVENSPVGVRSPVQLVGDLTPLNTAEIGDPTGFVFGVNTGVITCPN